MIPAKRIFALSVLTAGAVGVTVFAEHRRHRNIMADIAADLEGVAMAQGAHFEDYGTYTMDIAAYGYAPKHGSTVLIVKADSNSWDAIVTHAGTAMICAASVKQSTWTSPVCK